MLLGQVEIQVLVVRGTQQVKEQAKAVGLDKIFKEAVGETLLSASGRSLH